MLALNHDQAMSVLVYLDQNHDGCATCISADDKGKRLMSALSSVWVFLVWVQPDKLRLQWKCNLRSWLCPSTPTRSEMRL